MLNKKILAHVGRALVVQGVFQSQSTRSNTTTSTPPNHHWNVFRPSVLSTQSYLFPNIKTPRIIATSATSSTGMNQLTNVNPLQSPNSYFESHKDIGIAPDGTGLQILFDTGDGAYKLLLGPRAGKLLTVIGGAINNPSQSFLEQLKEEFKEETFGELTLDIIKNNVYLHVKRYNKTCLLEFQNDKAYLAGKPNKYAYVTFSATCKGLTSKELNGLADALSPTAQFWNKIGTFLFSQSSAVSKCKNDQEFLAYWTADNQVKARAKLKDELIKEYAANQSRLLISPLTVFGQKDIPSALNTLDQIQNTKQFNKVFRHDVGRYSERANFQVCHAKDILEKARANELFNSVAAASTLEAIPDSELEASSSKSSWFDLRPRGRY